MIFPMFGMQFFAHIRVFLGTPLKANKIERKIGGDNEVKIVIVVRPTQGIL